MKKLACCLVALACLSLSSAQASQMFHCKRAGDTSPSIFMTLHSFSEIEYSNDWDFDGTYNLVSEKKDMMWNQFQSSDEYLTGIEIQVQGKMFHGKPGSIKEVVYSPSAPDGKIVTTFQCAPGRGY